MDIISTREWQWLYQYRPCTTSVWCTSWVYLHQEPTQLDLFHKRRKTRTGGARLLENQLDYLILALYNSNDYTWQEWLVTSSQNDWLPLHKVLNDDATLGTIKLFAKGDPSALREVAAPRLSFPLHIACHYSTTEVPFWITAMQITITRCIILIITRFIRMHVMEATMV